MKNLSRILPATLLCVQLAAFPAMAQFGRGPTPPTPQLGGAMSRLFGENSAFSATTQMQMRGTSADVTMPGKIAFDDGKSRFEMDLSEAKSRDIPPGMAEQMKAMGMDKMVVISRPDQKKEYVIYPGLKAYAETPTQNPGASRPASDYKVETTELGRETVDGHACVKNKVIVTDETGKKHEFTVWNATDLKNFPIKTETVDQGNTITSVYKDVKLAKPAAAEFDPPSGFQRYNSVMELMQQEMMKRMGGMEGMGAPPARR